MKKFKLGDNIDIKSETKVFVDFIDSKFNGMIVGKATTDITQQHIVKCIDGSLPNDTYQYDTVVVPLSCITIIK